MLESVSLKKGERAARVTFKSKDCDKPKPEKLFPYLFKT